MKCKKKHSRLERRGRGGKGVGSELHIFIWNQTGLMDCYYVDAVIMQNGTMSRRCCTSVLSSRQMNTGRQSGLLEIKLQMRGVNISWTKSNYQEQSTACAGHWPPSVSLVVVVCTCSSPCWRLAYCLYSAAGLKTEEGGSRKTLMSG